MRKTLIALALATGAFAAGDVVAQQTPPPMTADAPPPPHRPMRGGGGGMGGLMAADTNHDGVITREEAIAAADARFDRLDTNHDGMLSADELRAGMPMTRPGGEGGAMASMTSMTRAQFHDRALRPFDRIDTNHDGKLDAAELANFREMMKERRQERRGGDMAPPAGSPPPPAAGQ